MASTEISDVIAKLQKYSACDIADALLKLDNHGRYSKNYHLAGFLADITPRNPSASSTSTSTSTSSQPSRKPPIIAPAYTVLFTSRLSPSTNQTPSMPSNIPPGAQWSDLIAPSTIVLISQPPSQSCAAVGGHHAARLSHLGAAGLVVSGRIRDLADMAELEMPIWARGTSVVGAGAEAKAWAVQVPVEVGGVVVVPGDLIVMDAVENAVVRVPRGLVQAVLDFLPKHAQQEEGVKEMIAGGSSVQEAFAKCRI